PDARTPTLAALASHSCVVLHGNCPVSAARTDCAINTLAPRTVTPRAIQLTYVMGLLPGALNAGFDDPRPSAWRAAYPPNRRSEKDVLTVWGSEQGRCEELPVVPQEQAWKACRQRKRPALAGLDRKYAPLKTL